MRPTWGRNMQLADVRCSQCHVGMPALAQQPLDGPPSGCYRAHSAAASLMPILVHIHCCAQACKQGPSHLAGGGYSRPGAQIQRDG